jgi:hypothetical protein
MTKYEILEAGTHFATIEAASADEALVIAEREYPRRRSDYNVEPFDGPGETEWLARSTDPDSGETAKLLVSVPAGSRYEE